jgi:hypothetical protein
VERKISDTPNGRRSGPYLNIVAHLAAHMFASKLILSPKILTWADEPGGTGHIWFEVPTPIVATACGYVQKKFVIDSRL